MAVGTIKKVQVVGTKTVPRLVYAPVTFDGSGLATVTATDLEASKILAVFGGMVWNTGVAVDHTITIRTAVYSDAGVASVDFNVLDENGSVITDEKTATILFAVE
jgi:hypothetical protein